MKTNSPSAHLRPQRHRLTPVSLTTIERPRWVHFTLFGFVLIELLEIELFSSGFFHHLWDGIVVSMYAYAALRISRSYKIFAGMMLLEGIPWVMGVLEFQLTAFNLQSVFWAMSHGLLAFVLTRSIFTFKKISAVEIVDVVSLYIVAGIAFANIYALILSVYPGALSHSTVPPGERLPFNLVLYYSFITQLTVGYGDIAPTHRLTRSLSIIQALFGVLYVAILISWHVALYSASHLKREG
ncbi:ion channel [Kiritimatiellota bacterium B12222]|nr:ion channel [Kiritimatiellota bacterium B12222]